MFRFEQLEIWKIAQNYAKSCYLLINKFPAHEKFALADQLRRASVSIATNIAEGSVGSSANFAKYLNTAIGSALETVSLLYFAKEVGYINNGIHQELYAQADILIRKISSLRNTLKD